MSDRTQQDSRSRPRSADPDVALGVRGAATPDSQSGVAGGSLVARNALWLVVGQVLTAALSFAVAAVLARQLGAEDYGIFYLAGAFVETAFTLVEFGQEYYIVRAVARQREGLGDLLGTGLAVRTAVALVIFPAVVAATRIFGYPDATRTAISLMLVFYLLGSLANGFSVVFRGVERMDYEAAARVALKALVAVATVVAVALGGGLNGVIEAQILGGAGALVIYVVIAHRLRIARLRVRARVAACILRGSAPFLLWTIVMTCDASVHAVMLSKLAPGEVVGWYAAATRFSSVLIFPATILAAALYPTLSRLFDEQPESYRRFVQSALRAMFLFGAPGAGGTLLFADDAVVLVYGQRAFGPAAATLRVLALYIFLDFVNITLGTAIMAANRQTPFIYAKGLCILLVISLNSLLIPLCQTRLANGSLGSAITSAAAEIVMLGAGLLLVPRGTLAPALLRDLARAVAAMVVMAGVTHLLGDVFPGGGIALGVLTYVAVVVGLGGVRREDVALLRSAVRLRSRAVAAGGP